MKSLVTTLTIISICWSIVYLIWLSRQKPETELGRLDDIRPITKLELISKKITAISQPSNDSLLRSFILNKNSDFEELDFSNEHDLSFIDKTSQLNENLSRNDMIDSIKKLNKQNDSLVSYISAFKDITDSTKQEREQLPGVVDLLKKNVTPVTLTSGAIKTFALSNSATEEDVTKFLIKYGVEPENTPKFTTRVMKHIKGAPLKRVSIFVTASGLAGIVQQNLFSSLTLIAKISIGITIGFVGLLIYLKLKE